MSEEGISFTNHLIENKHKLVCLLFLLLYAYHKFLHVVTVGCINMFIIWEFHDLQLEVMRMLDILLNNLIIECIKEDIVRIDRYYF